MKPLFVLGAVLVLMGCASTDYGSHELALGAVVTPGAREAAQQPQDLSNCLARLHHETTRLADTESDPASRFEAGARYAQLDDPTRDWTRERNSGNSSQCPRSGRPHRYFA